VDKYVSMLTMMNRHQKQRCQCSRKPIVKKFGFIIFLS